MGKERTYVTDTTTENLSAKTIGSANFSLYVFDKNNARIGEGYINLNNVGAGQTVKFQITLAASGTPASLKVTTAAPQTVSVTVNSVPQGALLRSTARKQARHRRLLKLPSASTRWSSVRRASSQESSLWKSPPAMLREAASAMNWVATRTTRSSCEMVQCSPEIWFRLTACKL
jgi:hypothetical protein